jgi:leucyl-tRNA synthetase
MKFLTQIERKWQKKWENKKIFEADPDEKQKKCFVTFPYSYANGPLHVGHGFTATRVDVYARFRRMQGYNVLFPWAWHWTGGTIAGASERVKQGDDALLRALKEIDGVPEEELKKFVDPAYMASYYTRENRVTVRRAGFSIDWRREFHTTIPTFNKFVEWQYKRLRRKGYVVKGTHPVVWCPHCQSPTGDADRYEGEGVSPEEYVLIKFEFENAYLPAATFRPETIYAVTNMWIHPDAHYVEAQVDNEKWAISKVAAEKLKEQKRKVKVIREFEGRESVGKFFVNPINKQKLPILPGWFVDPKNATGVVYSVPAHAPYDWLALRDLQRKPGSLDEFGVDFSMVKGIQPISMIQVKGFGEWPAVEIVEQLGVKDQNDSKAEEVTKRLYKKEFHGGTLKQICGKYAGKMVREIKEELIQNFKRENIADFMYDLPQPVVCRCLTPCIVKVLEGQWFLKYSDEAWKKKTREALRRISVYPKSAEQWFLTIIDWLREWACARKTGLGTPLPWSPDWVVETLSDSTIYMAFYTIDKFISEYGLTSEQLIPGVFDYVFLGEGNINEVAEKSRISPEILELIQNEFLYWYPVDLRVSGKELVPNHLTFYVFHHVALFPPKHWPKAIGVNGMLMIEGDKMSKSKGNWVTLRNAIGEYGADATRCALLLGAEEMDDPDWRKENVRDVRNKIESFYKLAENIMETAEEGKNGHLEQWLTSRLQRQIKTVTESLEEMKTRTAVETALFEVWKDIRWYKRRKGTTNPRALKKPLSIWVRLLAPFIPHISEEIWSEMREEGFISAADWPKYNDKEVDIQAEEEELLIKDVFSDTQNIIQATKIRPKKICYYVAAPWKWKTYLTSLKEAVDKRATVSGLMKELMADPKLKKKAKEVSKFIPKILDDVNQTPDEKKQRKLKISILDENSVLKEEAKEFLQGEFNAEIYVFQEENSKRYDPKNRSRLAKPYRPAIYIE